MWKWYLQCLFSSCKVNISFSLPLSLSLSLSLSPFITPPSLSPHPTLLLHSWQKLQSCHTCANVWPGHLSANHLQGKAEGVPVEGDELVGQPLWPGHQRHTGWWNGPRKDCTEHCLPRTFSWGTIHTSIVSIKYRSALSLFYWGIAAAYLCYIRTIEWMEWIVWLYICSIRRPGVRSLLSLQHPHCTTGSKSAPDLCHDSRYIYGVGVCVCVCWKDAHSLYQLALIMYLYL